jgi:hypothetical protein
MADGFVKVSPDSTGKFIDTDELTVGANVVERQRVRIAGAGATDLVLADAAFGLDVDVTRLPGSLTGKAEDAAHVSGDVGMLLLAVRRDAASSGVSADGDYAALSVDSTGALRVTGSAGGTSMVDDAAFTPATTQITPVGGTYRSSRDLVDDNDAGAFAMTQRRAMLIAVETPLGDSAMDEGLDALRVSVVGGNPVQYVEDGAHSSGDAGLLLLGVRRDADTTPVSANGDYHALQFDNLGNLKVNIKAGAGSGGTSMVDDAAFTPDSSAVTPMGCYYDGFATDLVDDGDIGVPRMSSNRNQYVQIRDGFDNERGASVSASGSLSVRLSETQATVSITTEGRSNHDATFAFNPHPIAARSYTTEPPNVNNDNDVCVLWSDRAGRLHTLPEGAAAHDAAIAGNPLQMGGRASAALPTPVSADGDVSYVWLDRYGRVVTASEGTVPNDSADAGSPVKVGGKARTTNPANVQDADRVDAAFDKSGRIIVTQEQPRELVASATVTISNTTETDLLAAGGANVFQDVVELEITNGSAVALRVDIRDAAAGTVRRSYNIAANGGLVKGFRVALPQTASNNKWTAQLSATPTSSDVRIGIIAVKNL